MASGINHQLLLATALKMPEKESSRINAVPADGEQAMILVDCRTHAIEGQGNIVARAAFNRYLTRFVADHHMVHEKDARVLGDWRQRPSQRRIGAAVHCSL